MSIIVTIMFKILGFLAKSRVTILRTSSQANGRSQNERLVHLEKENRALKIRGSQGFLLVDMEYYEDKLWSNNYACTVNTSSDLGYNGIESVYVGIKLLYKYTRVGNWLST